MSKPFDQKTLAQRYVDILAAARKHFGTDRVQREPLREWYEEIYGKKPGAKKAYVPKPIIFNSYLQIGNGWYWVDPSRMHQPANVESEPLRHKTPDRDLGKMQPRVNAQEGQKAKAFDDQERSAGFQSNPKIRRAVEKYAMAKATARLSELGFRNFEDTSARRCYDYTCEHNGIMYYVEVKGTQGLGRSLILTKNEVEHGQKHRECSIAVIVHGVKVVQAGKSFNVSGGESRVCNPWVLRSEALKVLQYQWTVLAY